MTYELLKEAAASIERDSSRSRFVFERTICFGDHPQSEAVRPGCEVAKWPNLKNVCPQNDQSKLVKYYFNA